MAAHPRHPEGKEGSSEGMNFPLTLFFFVLIEESQCLTDMCVMY